MQWLKDTLAGRVVLVTGSGSGIGKATAVLFAQAGARVVAFTHKQEEADSTCEELTRCGGDCLPLAGDVSEPVDMERAYAAVQERFQRLDFVIANAGINGVWAPLDVLTADDWDRTLAVNLRGTFLTVKLALPLLRATGGAVVVISSVNGTRIFSNTGATAYSASKAGQVAFARMTALELARHHIRINTICPGAIDTRIDENTTKKDLEGLREKVEFAEGGIPLTRGRSGSAGQVAQLAWFLCSDLSAHITGTEVFIDGGQSLLQG